MSDSGRIPTTEQRWRPIDTLPDEYTRENGPVLWWWVTPKTQDDPHYCDTSGNSILPPAVGPVGVSMRGYYGRWSSLMKATHWMPDTAPVLPPHDTSAEYWKGEYERAVAVLKRFAQPNPSGTVLVAAIQRALRDFIDHGVT